jgi:DNA-binding transcriptional LysR family regulator
VVHGTVWDTLQPIADIAITVNRDNEVPEGAVRLWIDELTLVAAPGFFRDRRQDGLRRELRSVGTVLIHGRYENWGIMAEALGVTKLNLERGVKTNASNIALALAAKGVGYTITVRRLAQPLIDGGLVTEPFAIRPASPWNYYLRAMHSRKSHAIRSLEDWLLHSSKSLRCERST